MRKPHRFQRGDELGYIIVTIQKAFEVRDALGRLETESKIGWSGGKPGFQSLFCGQRAEGVVDLDGVELCRVELQEALGGCTLGIEIRLPGRVSPA